MQMFCSCSSKVDHTEKWWWPSVHKSCAVGLWCNLPCGTGMPGLPSNPAPIKVGDLSPRCSRKAEWALWRTSPVLSSSVSFSLIPHEQCPMGCTWAAPPGLGLTPPPALSSPQLPALDPPQMACALTLQSSTKLKPIYSHHLLTDSTVTGN